MSFVINQIFESDYPSEAARWCNENGAYIDELAPVDGVRRFQIVAVPAPTEAELAKARIAELQAYLAETDWYVVRYADTGEAIPEDVKAKRQAAREEISNLRGDA